jgi:hypothetical protein
MILFTKKPLFKIISILLLSSTILFIIHHSIMTEGQPIFLYIAIWAVSSFVGGYIGGTCLMHHILTKKTLKK